MIHENDAREWENFMFDLGVLLSEVAENAYLVVLFWRDEGGHYPYWSVDRAENFEVGESFDLFTESVFVYLWDAVGSRFLGDSTFLQFDVDWVSVPVTGFGFKKSLLTSENVV